MTLTPYLNEMPADHHNRPDTTQQLLDASHDLLAHSATGRHMMQSLHNDGVTIEILSDSQFDREYGRYGYGVRIRTMRDVPTSRGVVRHSGSSVFVLTRSLLDDPAKTALVLVNLAAQHLYDFSDRSRLGGEVTGPSERRDNSTTGCAVVSPCPEFSSNTLGSHILGEPVVRRFDRQSLASQLRTQIELEIGKLEVS